MQVTVLLFASYQDAVGKPQLSLTLEDEATVADCSRLLIQSYPNLALRLNKGRVAINSEFAADETSLKDGDEIAYLPPMSGG